jgi:hypothetical protein
MVRKPFVVSILSFLLILAATRALAVEITSIRPVQVSPGDSLYIAFKQATFPVKVLLGEQSLELEQTESGLLYYRVPAIRAGEYAVQFLDNGNVVTSSFKLTVLEAVPTIESVDPANIPECAEIQEKKIDVFGRNFLPESRLLVDGALVQSTVKGSQQISFDASPLRSGTHGVQVVNPAGTKSIPFSLHVNNVPKIDSVSYGANYTNYYELVISGGNFFQQSTLLVTEAPPGLHGIRPKQKVVWGKGRRLSKANLLDQEQEDYLFYEDCNTLIYYRFPASGQERNVTLKVINPDGKASGSYQMLAN